MLNSLLLVAASVLAAGTPAPAEKPAAQPAAPAATATSAAAPVHPKVAIKTNMGDPIVVELFPDKAPKSVDNFLQYVKDKSYNGTIFHRVIDGFMIQGGGFTKDMRQKPTRAPIANEANNGLSNTRYTVAMARTGDPNSATSQFFISVADNPRLDYVSSESGATWGYAVFGKVISGTETVDKIKSVETGPRPPMTRDVPKSDVIIESIEVVQ